jgi:hypothetical protein
VVKEIVGTGNVIEHGRYLFLFGNRLTVVRSYFFIHGDWQR